MATLCYLEFIHFSWLACTESGHSFTVALSSVFVNDYSSDSVIRDDVISPKYVGNQETCFISLRTGSIFLYMTRFLIYYVDIIIFSFTIRKKVSLERKYIIIL